MQRTITKNKKKTENKTENKTGTIEGLIIDLALGVFVSIKGINYICVQKPSYE